MLAQKVDCAKRDHRDKVERMRAKKAKDIQQASSSLIASFRFHDYLPWAPVVDKNFLCDSPQNLRKKGDFNHVPFMISYNSHEGASALAYMVNYSLGLMESVENGGETCFVQINFYENCAGMLETAGKLRVH